MPSVTHPIRLLWITERFPPLPGGMAVSAHRQVSSLRRRGIVTDVLVFHNTPSGSSVSIQRLEKDCGTDIIITHPDTHGNAAQRGWREVFERASAHPYHLIMGFGCGFSGHTAVTYASWLSVPSMVSVRGNDFDRDWFDPKRGLFVREALERADAVAAVSIEKTDKIKALFPRKHVFWSPNGIDSELWHLLPSELDKSQSIRAELNGNGKRIIGLFGELKYKKQAPLLLSALREHGLKDAVSLLVTGRLDAETDAILSDATLAPSYRHMSFRSTDALPPLYAACDFIAIPSLFEGFPNVLLEAMATGAVPIVSDAGAMGDVITHGTTGYMFNGTSAADLGNALTHALSLSDSDLSAMKDRVRRYVKDRFSRKRETDILESEIRSLVEPQSHSSVGPTIGTHDLCT